MRAATRDDWPDAQAMPSAVPLAVEHRAYSAEQYRRLRKGLVPEGMDSRWFVHVDSEHVVHVHRSWSGFEIYRVRLEPDGDGMAVAEAWVNGDVDQYRGDPDHDAGAALSWLDRLAD